MSTRRARRAAERRGGDSRWGDKVGQISDRSHSVRSLLTMLVVLLGTPSYTRVSTRCPSEMSPAQALPPHHAPRWLAARPLLSQYRLELRSLLLRLQVHARAQIVGGCCIDTYAFVFPSAMPSSRTIQRSAKPVCRSSGRQRPYCTRDFTIRAWAFEHLLKFACSICRRALVCSSMCSVALSPAPDSKLRGQAGTAVH